MAAEERGGRAFEGAKEQRRAEEEEEAMEKRARERGTGGKEEKRT